MKKSEFKKLIKEELMTLKDLKPIKEFEEDENDLGPGYFFASNDGWDKNKLEEAGIMDWITDVESVAYELKNARRGSYGIDGDTDDDLINKLKELYNGLENILGFIREYLLDNQ